MISLPNDWRVYAATGGVVVAAVLIIYFVGKHEITQGVKAAGDLAGKVGNAINPVNDENVFAQSTNAVLSKIAGQQETTGTFLSRWLGTKADAIDWSAPVKAPVRADSAPAPQVADHIDTTYTAVPDGGSI